MTTHGLVTDCRWQPDGLVTPHCSLQSTVVRIPGTMAECQCRQKRVTSFQHREGADEPGALACPNAVHGGRCSKQPAESGCLLAVSRSGLVQCIEGRLGSQAQVLQLLLMWLFEEFGVSQQSAAHTPSQADGSLLCFNNVAATNFKMHMQSASGASNLDQNTAVRTASLRGIDATACGMGRLRHLEVSRLLPSCLYTVFYGIKAAEAAC